MMHPFHLAQVVYIGGIIIFILGLFVLEKITKKTLFKTKNILYSLTIILLINVILTVFFFLFYDYSLTFPKDYYQPYEYLFLLFALFIFGKIFTQKGLDNQNLGEKDKLLLIISLALIVMVIIVPTSEKIFDRYQYMKAENILTDGDNRVETAIINDVSGCRENPSYRKTYQLFDCELAGSRIYYVFAKNRTGEKRDVRVTLDLYDKNKTLIQSIESQEVILQPDEVGKVVFDEEVLFKPNWMQHSFYLKERSVTSHVELEYQ